MKKLTPIPPELKELAKLLGVELTYVDNEGEQRSATKEALTQLLPNWGLHATKSSGWRDALLQYHTSHWSRQIEPVIVAWEGARNFLKVRLPDSLGRKTLSVTIRAESGIEVLCRWDLSRSQRLRVAKIDGRLYAEYSLQLPVLARGYHWLSLSGSDPNLATLVICAPTISYRLPAGQSYLGLFLPVYAAHSSTSWGSGNFSDFTALARWAADCGANVIGSLPLTAIAAEGDDINPSPYSPISRLFWSEFLIDVTTLPELADCAEAKTLLRSQGFQRKIKDVRAEHLIDYPRQAAIRRQVLQLLSKRFFSSAQAQSRDFQQFLLQRPELDQFAGFRACCRSKGSNWQRWPAAMRDGALHPGDFDEAEKRYHLYAQWSAERQIQKLLVTCGDLGMRLYLDLPVGVSSTGYDMWCHRDAFAAEVSAGAPPDAFFTRGQNWGFSPLHPQGIRDSRYTHVIDFLRFQMSHCDVLRIDHVMGLHRLFWIPPGLPPAQGVYVRYRAEEFFAILCLESHRNQVALIGENLGTVPPEVSRLLERHQVDSMYVAQFERRSDPEEALREPGANSVASLNTHDTPTFMAHWRGEDIREKERLGLITAIVRQAELQERRELNKALWKFLGLKPPISDRAVAKVLERQLSWLSAGKSTMLLVTLEDLWLEERPQNVPGTSTERPNWRRKTAVPLERIFRSAEYRRILSRLKALRRSAPSAIR